MAGGGPSTGGGRLPLRPADAKPLGAARWEPPGRGLLEDLLDGLRDMDTRPSVPAGQERAYGRIAAALAAESARNGAWRAAVVFRTCRPVRMDLNGGWDFDLFLSRRQAEAAMLAPQSAVFAEPYLWERDEDGWYRAI